MSNSDRERPTYRFGVFELDLRSSELRKRGIRLRLQDQPLQVLALLLERPGEVISREDIQKRLWPANTYVDFDNAINSSVRKLRDAIGDTAENPRFIETLARRGYRFIAPVTMLGSPNLPYGATTPDASSVSHGRNRKLVSAGLSILGVLLVLGVVTIWYFGRGKRLPAESPAGIPVPLTSYAGFQSFPTFSPEGSRVAFAWDASGGGESSIYVKLIGSPEPFRLTIGDKGDFAPAWSPDGRWVAFLRARQPLMCEVMLIPSLGGRERELTHLQLEAEAVLAHIDLIMPRPYLAWSLDGKWLLSLEQSGPDQPTRIVRISVETGEKVLLLPSPEPGRTARKGVISGESGLAIAPGGRQLAFLHADLPVSTAYVVEVSEDLRPAGKPERLGFAGNLTGGIAWDSQGRSLIMSSNQRGLRELWRVPASPSGETKLLNVNSDTPSDVAVSAAGHRLVYTHTSEDWNIWRVGIAGTHLNEATTLIGSTRKETRASYSVDGKRIAFESDRSGNEEIWISDADGSHTAQLTHFDNAWAGSPRWSPDGQWIAFDCNAGGQWHVYVIRAEGGKPVRLTKSSATEIRPSWSHDGKWIYYCSTRSGIPQIWKNHADSGDEVQVTRNGASFDAVESPDGAYIYYGHSGNSLWRIPTEGGDETEVLGPNSTIAFTVAKIGIYLVDADRTPSLKFLDIRTQSLKTIGTIPGTVITGLSISPDERWLLYARREAGGSQLILVENFR